MKRNNKVISLLPENYEKNNFNYFYDKNFMEFKFYEHDDYVKKYITKKRYPNKKFSKKYHETIRFPISKGIFDSRVEVQYIENELHYVSNLLYESVQKYGGSPESVVNSMKETYDYLSAAAGNTLEDLKAAWERGILESGSDAVGSLWNTFSSAKTYEDLIDTIKSVPPDLVNSEAGKLAIGFGTALALSNDSAFIRGVKFSEGVAYNPNVRPLFQGNQQERRFFQITFQFFPKSRKEVQLMREAEYILQKNALPTLWKGGLGYTSKYINHFKEPKKIEITIYIDGKPYNKYKILDSVIDLCTITQNPEHTNNTFIQDEDEKIFSTEFQILIQFRETKIFTANDVDVVFSGVDEAYERMEFGLR